MVWLVTTVGAISLPEVLVRDAAGSTLTDSRTISFDDGKERLWETGITIQAHFRTTQPHAGITMKDNLFWPGFILLVVAFSGVISATAAAAYGHYEWLPTTVLVAVLGTVAAALWFVVELRRVTRIDEQWHVPDADAPPRQRAAS